MSKIEYRGRQFEKNLRPHDKLILASGHFKKII
jgi:hypothetical protein